jgi:hypothetical protein
MPYGMIMRAKPIHHGEIADGVSFVPESQRARTDQEAIDDQKLLVNKAT